VYLGGIVPPEIDYMEVGETLFRELRIDYTYVHPEVLTQKCLVSGNKLVLNNIENREEYRVLIVPGGNTISVAAAMKMRDFYRSGGTLIATSKLPYLSAEFHQDKAVQQIMSDIFQISVADLAAGRISIDKAKRYLLNHNDAGGSAFFLPKAEAPLLSAVLKEAIPVPDVDIQEATWPQKEGSDYQGALTYIHKVKDGRDIYFFSNSSQRQVDAVVTLRGAKALVIWDPHTGGRQEAHAQHPVTRGNPITTIRLRLAPFTSTFYVQVPFPEPGG
jgi:hypothetical protein